MSSFDDRGPIEEDGIWGNLRRLLMAGWGAFIGRGFVGGQKKTWGSYLRGHESSE